MVELSEQQIKTLDLFSKEGLNMKDIATHLGVSYSRVINILNEILVKTGYKTRKELLINANNLEYSLKK